MLFAKAALPDFVKWLIDAACAIWSLDAAALGIFAHGKVLFSKFANVNARPSA
jgi:hypothetical protein